MKKVFRVLYGVDLRLGQTSVCLYSNLCMLKLELVGPLLSRPQARYMDMKLLVLS